MTNSSSLVAFCVMAKGWSGAAMARPWRGSRSSRNKVRDGQDNSGAHDRRQEVDHPRVLLGTATSPRSASGASRATAHQPRLRSWEAAWKWDGVDSVKVVKPRSFPDAPRPSEGRDGRVWLRIAWGEVAIPTSRPGLNLHASSQRQPERQDPVGACIAGFYGLQWLRSWSDAINTRSR